MLEQIMTVGFVTAFLTASVRMAVPLIYAGLGETISEKAGILNIGMEGVMLGGAMVSAIHGLLSIRLARDQSVSGIAINIFMAGVTSFLYKLMSSGQSYQQIEPFAKLKIPFLGDIPLIGNALFNQDVLTYGVYVLVILVTLFYSRTSKGMAFAAIGENPRAADSAGIPVHRYQWAAVLLNGMLGGLGGAYLVLVQVGNFSENMTSGRGYIALAAVILGRYVPFGMMGAAFIFGAANALQIRLQAIGVPLPTQALAMLPYIITLVALLGAIGKNSAPEALGKPYIRGAR